MTHKGNIWWTFAITSTALFMVTLDNLVVTTALPVIRKDLHSGLSGLEWTVNAYTLVFAVLLLTGAALALARLDESHGPASRLDLPGVVLASGGLFGIVWGLVRGNGVGWGSPEIVGALVGGAFVLAAFVAWELRTSQPMLPMRFFRNRTFALANISSLFMFFGMFG